MGGYGALRLAFRHPELFGSVSAHSAALIEKLPAVALADSGQTASLRILGDVFGSPPDRAFWERNNPLTLARTAHLAGLKIYFDCGSEDNFGFHAGAKALNNLLASRRIPHEFHLYPGGHNWPYFAEHLPASPSFIPAPSASVRQTISQVQAQLPTGDCPLFDSASPIPFDSSPRCLSTLD